MKKKVFDESLRLKCDVLRARQGLSKIDLAKKLKMSYPTFKRIYTGETGMTDATIRLLLWMGEPIVNGQSFTSEEYARMHSFFKTHTQTEVARKIGVSKATVSLAVRGSDVSKKVHDSIMEVVDE